MIIRKKDEGLYELEESLHQHRLMIDSNRLFDYESDFDSVETESVDLPEPLSLKPYAVNEEERKTKADATKKIAYSIDVDSSRIHWGQICVAFLLGSCCAVGIVILILDPTKYQFSTLNAINDRPFDTSDKPIFFHNYQNNLDFIRELLYECYGFDESLVTSSLCQFQETFHQNKKKRIFASIQNPIVSTAFAFASKQDPKRPEYSSLVANMSFDEYLKSSFMEKNLLIKAIICKSNDKLTTDDLERAKAFLRNENVSVSFQYYEDAFREYESAFLSKSSFKSKNCSKKKFLEIKDSERLRIPQIVIDAYTKELSELNAFDLELFRYAFNVKEESRQQKKES